MPKYRTKSVDVVIASSGNKSAGFEVPSWALFAGVLIPDIDAGAVGLEISKNGGNNYYSLLNPSTGNAAAICASGSDPGWVDFSDFIRFMGDNQSHNMFARFSAATQTANRTLTVLLRG